MRYLIIGALGFIGFVSIVSVNAWQDASILPEQCSMPPDVLAQDGDVVTTDKWNQTMCYIKHIFAVVQDWPRGMTPGLSSVANTIA